MSVLFYILSAIAVLAGLGVVIARSPINSVISLIICFLAIAGHYIILNAQFLAVVHIIVYMGAIMVLFIFVIMLLNLNKVKESFDNLWIKLAALISGGLLFLVLIAAVSKTPLVATQAPVSANIGLIRELGLVLYRDYLFPFEASAILFLAAMVGAVLIGKREPKID
jgi:NADH-quinone oxidoreductase subunit J